MHKVRFSISFQKKIKIYFYCLLSKILFFHLLFFFFFFIIFHLFFPTELFLWKNETARLKNYIIKSPKKNLKRIFVDFSFLLSLRKSPNIFDSNGIYHFSFEYEMKI